MQDRRHTTNRDDILTPTQVVREPYPIADDERGVIEQLARGEFQSVLRITSKQGTVRANHYHQYDSHLCYLASGKIRYVERPALQEQAPLAEYIIEPGQVFYTAPMMAHAMEFLEDTVFYCFTPRSARQNEYEEDVVRVILIDPIEAEARARREQ